MIVTGCQRSGTKTIAKIFGIYHEKQFTPRLDWQTACEIKNILSESSWMARPFVSLLLQRHIPIIHLVRHPLDVISSLLGSNFWGEDPKGILDYKPYQIFICTYIKIPEEESISTASQQRDIFKSLFYWVYWNQPLEQFPRICIEDFQNTPTLNAIVLRGHERAEISWDDIIKSCPSSLIHKAEEMLDKYGYKI